MCITGSTCSGKKTLASKIITKFPKPHYTYGDKWQCAHELYDDTLDQLVEEHCDAHGKKHCTLVVTVQQARLPTRLQRIIYIARHIGINVILISLVDPGRKVLANFDYLIYTSYTHTKTLMTNWRIVPRSHALICDYTRRTTEEHIVSYNDQLLECHKLAFLSGLNQEQSSLCTFRKQSHCELKVIQIVFALIDPLSTKINNTS